MQLQGKQLNLELPIILEHSKIEFSYTIKKPEIKISFKIVVRKYRGWLVDCLTVLNLIAPFATSSNTLYSSVASKV
ncbi:hypothetical protein AHMF7616_05353 [Adhaeribacter pallidiroseus]|uniref:Uncharacterized protein n=1 Tax=Adhaeribacter pallidiroseus TaxID=2072847 RepID=A0A369Q5A0_9BACT|nr:hypothetical protein AHMF7616_05309 [Adhaeribacter pallidiroseus]RDC58719.1 hypothetical protein AHMF7616_05353 [Adhaeribacter pallidiroseus]